MKKLFLISLILFTCNPRAVITAQDTPPFAKEKSTPALDSAWARLYRSNDTTTTLITNIKKLATQKVVYRTKLILRIDTVWRVDTCVAILMPLDSARIAILFQQRTPPKKTKAGKIIEYITHPFKNKKQDPEEEDPT